MQAVERIIISKDWVTAIILLSFFLLVLLKFLDQDRLRGYFSFFFNKSFIEAELFENPPFFSLFNLIFIVFNALSFSLLFLMFFSFYGSVTFTFFTFSVLFSVLFLFQIIQIVLQKGIASLLAIKGSIPQTLLLSQRGYLCSISIYIFIVNIVFFYVELHPIYIFYSAIFIFGIGMLFFVNLNKKLIVSKLFYFILYLCAFKLAPLVVLFKLII